MVYPNPVSDMLTFTTSDLPDGKYFITISDIQGKIVYFDTATLRNNENKQINTTAFRDGMYVLTLMNQNNSLNSSIKFCGKIMGETRIKQRFDLDGKVAIITGASRGIGESMARAD